MNADDLARLQYLLREYTSGLCTKAERDELVSLIKRSDQEESVRQFIELEMEKGIPASLDQDQQLSPKRADILFSKIIGNKKRKIVKLKQIWRLAAAAFILGIIGMLAYFLVAPSKPADTLAAIKKPATQVENDALPGKQGAILTLSNGQQIILDSAGNGKLTSQGSTVIVNNNGQVAYDIRGAVSGEILYNTMTTPRGRQYQLLLSDGTKVWLNSESSIRYPAAFAGDTRSVTITGEAYFEVAPAVVKSAGGEDKKIPFIVKAENMEVKVLGTHFNINAYQDEESIRTTLLEGSVQVTIPGDATVLTPGQQSKIYKRGPIKLVENADLEEAVAWKNGVFSFNDADIQSVMRQIGRWFDLVIAYEGEIPGDSFGGKLPMNAKVSEILAALEQTQVHFRVEGKKLVVLP
ncbi:MAG: FecR domain-containing protein [Ferruginibacter sp.]